MLTAVPVLEPLLVAILRWLRPGAGIRCETLDALVSACAYLPG